MNSNPALMTIRRLPVTNTKQLSGVRSQHGACADSAAAQLAHIHERISISCTRCSDAQGPDDQTPALLRAAFAARHSLPQGRSGVYLPPFARTSGQWKWKCVCCRLQIAVACVLCAMECAIECAMECDTQHSSCCLRSYAKAVGIRASACVGSRTAQRDASSCRQAQRKRLGRMAFLLFGYRCGGALKK
jgi:hypothetical protein